MESILKEARKVCYTTKLKNSFGVGASVHIRIRVEAMMREPEKEQVVESSSMALALVGLYQVEMDKNAQWISDQGIELVTYTCGRSRFMDEGYIKGYDYGGKVSLNPQVENEDKTKGILPK